MIRIYERSPCQSYASAYRQGILLAKTDDEAEALSIVESLTDDSYQCFALLEDGTVLDLRGRFPGCVEVASTVNDEERREIAQELRHYAVYGEGATLSEW